jgi:hypothetical protein
MKITNLLKTMLALGLVPMSGTTASANLLSNGNLDAVSVG